MNNLYRLLVLCWLVTTSHFSLTQTPMANYIISRIYKQAGVNENLEGSRFAATANQATSQVSYFDGRSKPTQQVMAFGAGYKADIVTLVQYDALQRPIRTSLANQLTTSARSFWVSSDLKAAAPNYYIEAGKVSATIVTSASLKELSTQIFYDDAPFNRITGSKASRAADNSTQSHRVNAIDEVKYYCSGTGLINIQLNNPNESGELTYVRTMDEVDGTVPEYLDRLGRMVLGIYLPVKIPRM